MITQLATLKSRPQILDTVTACCAVCMSSKGNILWLAVATTLLAGCRKPETGTRTFDLQGTVVAVAANKRSVTLAHEEIPGFMQAMTMPFPVKETSLLEGVRESDLVRGQLTVTGKEGWLSQLKVLKKGDGPKPQDRSKAVPIQHLLQPGEDVPEIALVDQEGRPLRPGDFQGKVLVINFIFSRCPFPSFCPWMSNRFREVQQELQRHNPQLLARTHFVSITLDPEFDTPAVLLQYGRGYEADFKRWSFATGSRDDIARFASHFGCSFWNDPRVTGLPTHNLVTAIVRPDGKLLAAFRGSEWTLEEFVSGLKQSFLRNQSRAS